MVRSDGQVHSDTAAVLGIQRHHVHYGLVRVLPAAVHVIAPVHDHVVGVHLPLTVLAPGGCLLRRAFLTTVLQRRHHHHGFVYLSGQSVVSNSCVKPVVIATTTITTITTNTAQRVNTITMHKSTMVTVMQIKRFLIVLLRPSAVQTTTAFAAVTCTGGFCMISRPPTCVFR